MQNLEENKYHTKKKWNENSLAEKIIIISGVSILFGSIIGFYIAGKIQTAEIKNNKGWTTGQITDCRKVGGSGWSLKYTYIVDGIEYKNFNTGKRIKGRNCKFFMGKYFPVVYSTKNPKKSSILMTPYAFMIQGLAYPDSLRWTTTLWGF